MRDERPCDAEDPIFAWTRHVLTGPPGGYVIVGPSMDAINHEVLYPMEDVLGRISARAHMKISTSGSRAYGYAYVGHMRIYLVTYQRADRQLLGLDIAGVMIPSNAPVEISRMARSRMRIDGGRRFEWTT